MLTTLLNFLYPPPEGHLSKDELIRAATKDCDDGRFSIEFPPDLRLAGIDAIDALRSCVQFQQTKYLREALHRWKYNGGRVYGRCLSAVFTKYIPHDHEPNSIVLCPVPLHWSRRLLRGFNQADVLAKRAARTHHFQVEHLLRRKKPTGHQAHRTREQRLVAVQDAFVVRSKAVPKHVALVDDIATTGSTLNACAKALKAAGVETVEAWVLARD